MVEARKHGDEFETTLKAETLEQAKAEAHRMLSYLTEKERLNQDSFLVYADKEKAEEAGLSIFEAADELFDLSQN